MNFPGFRLCAGTLLALALVAPAATSSWAQGVDEEDDDEASSAAPNTFNDVNVRRVDPSEIPDHRPGLPSPSSRQGDLDELPRTLRDGDLSELTATVSAATVEIVAVQTPPRPYRATPMVYRGHALWISPHRSGEDPVLVTTADWLADADEVYALDGEVSQALSRGGLEAGDTTSQSLDDFTAGDQTLLEEYESALLELDVSGANRHLNLARLVVSDTQRLPTPDKGLILHDMEDVLPGHLFGYSPAVGTEVTPVRYHNSEDLEDAYSFYFLVDFAAILGAPIVGPDGTLLAINALRHPEDGSRSLAIPPGAIHAFLETGRADPDSDDDDDDDDDDSDANGWR